MEDHAEQRPARFWRSRTALVLLGFVAVAAFFLITEHTAHLFGAIPFLLLLLCPLMHLFGHGGHGAEHAGHSDARRGRPDSGTP